MLNVFHRTYENASSICLMLRDQPTGIPAFEKWPRTGWCSLVRRCRQFREYRENFSSGRVMQRLKRLRPREKALCLCALGKDDLMPVTKEMAVCNVPVIIGIFDAC